MATKKSTEEGAPSRFAGVVAIDPTDVPTTGHVREPKAEVKELRALLDQSFEQNTPLALPCTPEEVDPLRALIHRAAVINGGDKLEIGTRYDAKNGRITFGPKSFFRKTVAS